MYVVVIPTYGIYQFSTRQSTGTSSSYRILRLGGGGGGGGSVLVVTYTSTIPN